MHCHCGTNDRAPRWTFTDPCKPGVRPGAREESASPAWLATPAMNGIMLSFQHEMYRLIRGGVAFEELTYCRNVKVPGMQQW